MILFFVHQLLLIVNVEKRDYDKRIICKKKFNVIILLFGANVHSCYIYFEEDISFYIKGLFRISKSQGILTKIWDIIVSIVLHFIRCCFVNLALKSFILFIFDN